ETYHPDMKVSFGGGFRSQQDEYQSVRNDILLSGGTTIGGILLLLFLFFRRLRVAVVVLVPLVMSISWPLAIAFLAIGYLNLVTAFIFAILLGLGIDFGIHILARYDEERSRGRDPVDAMTEAIVEVGAANTAGA